MKYFLVIILLMTFKLGSVAQSNDTSVTVLQEVTLKYQRVEFIEKTLYTQKLDSNTSISIDPSLSEQLKRQTGISIRSYGAGQLATISTRGTSASHTQLMWNGLPITNPQNGMADLSLIPAGFFDEISIQYGGQSFLYGSGAIGGVIQLDNLPLYKSTYSADARLSVGSFGNYQGLGIVRSSSLKHATSIKYGYLNAQNAYRYTLEKGDTLLQGKMRNSDASMHSVLIEHAQKFSSKHQLIGRIWYQDSKRNTPDVLKPEHSAQLLDQNIRMGLEWMYKLRSYTQSVRAGWMIGNSRFEDSLSKIQSKHNTLFQAIEYESKVRIWRHTELLMASNAQLQSIQSNNMVRSSINRLMLMQSLLVKQSMFNDRLSIYGGIRLDNLHTPIPSMGVSFLHRKILLRANSSLVYRIPTFNDLYWNPGGNTSLKSEDGYSVGAGAELSPLNTSKHSAKLIVDLFKHSINNWIIWLPSTTYWTPQNVAKVHSQGIELALKTTSNIGKWQIVSKATYTYTLSTNKKSITEGDNSIGKQLIFIPYNTGLFKVFLIGDKLSIRFWYMYTGFRFTTSDNSSWLPAYSLLHGAIEKSFFKKSNIPITISIQCDNILNTMYENMPNRPLPGRSVQVSVRVLLSKNQSIIN